MSAHSLPRQRAREEPDRAVQLRADFDRGFARPITAHHTQLLDVLTLRIDQELYAVPLNEIAEVAVRPAITNVPTATPPFLGLAASRGRVVAAFDLGALLGGTLTPPSWLLIPAAEPSVGMTFEQFEGYRQIPPAASSQVRLIGVSTLIDAVRALTGDIS